MNRTVLLVEDDRELRTTLRDALQREGYAVTTAASQSEAQALLAHAYAQAAPDLVLLDLGLPDGEGETLLPALKARGGSAVIVLSARHGDTPKVRLLDAGADDYLVKPFGLPELLARMRVALRHRAAPGAPDPLRWSGEGVEIDVTAHRVWRDGEPVHLTPTEFRLLARLVRQAGQVVTHRRLLAEVWGPEHVDDTPYLRLYLGQLRAKLERDPAAPRLLLTEPGMGYRLVEGER